MSRCLKSAHECAWWRHRFRRITATWITSHRCPHWFNDWMWCLMRSHWWLTDLISMTPRCSGLYIPDDHCWRRAWCLHRHRQDRSLQHIWTWFHQTHRCRQTFVDRWQQTKHFNCHLIKHRVKVKLLSKNNSICTICDRKNCIRLYYCCWKAARKHSRSFLHKIFANRLPVSITSLHPPPTTLLSFPGYTFLHISPSPNLTKQKVCPQ